MRRLIECQLAIVPWGTKARYRIAKLGLIRKGPQVYIAVFLQQNQQQKFQIKPGSVQILPAAIRLLDIQSDLFVRHVTDEQLYNNMLRGVKVLLRRDDLRKSGKSDKLEMFIADIPQMSSLRRSDLHVATQSVRLGAKGDQVLSSHQQPTSTQTASMDLDTDGLDSWTDGERAYFNELRKEEIRRLDNSRLKSIKFNGLHHIPDQLWQANSVIELDLAECNLTRFPKKLENLALTLRRLDLSKNKIKRVPRTFCCKMSRLSYLNLSHNLIETLPLEIKFLKLLYEFNMSHNCLKMLPTTLSDLRSLKVLKVDSNRLSQLPAFRREDIRLAELDISHNPLDGALRHFSTFEVHPSYHDDQYDPFSVSFMCLPSANSTATKDKNKILSLFELSILTVVRSDDLFKKASEEPLPKTIVTTIQRDIFKCYRCNKMNILPAYNSTDTLDYVDHIENLKSSGNYCSSMTFMKLLCRTCFDYMSS